MVVSVVVTASQEKGKTRKRWSWASKRPWFGFWVEAGRSYGMTGFQAVHWHHFGDVPMNNWDFQVWRWYFGLVEAAKGVKWTA